MKNNKKMLIIAIIIIIIILAIGFGICKIHNDYMFNEDGTLSDGHTELLQHLRNIEDKEERKKQVDFSLESNIITQEEAKELY